MIPSDIQKPSHTKEKKRRGEERRGEKRWEGRGKKRRKEEKNINTETYIFVQIVHSNTKLWGSDG